jgi:pilus assembly protein FimV
VKNTKFKQWVIAALLLLPWTGHAAGLGRLTVLSSLGQPFQGEVEIVAARSEEIGTLSARIAPQDAYRQANLQYSPGLSGMRLSIEKRPNGDPYIRITSNRPTTELFINLLIELNWSTGQYKREYSALIDPPAIEPAQPVASAPAAEPQVRPVPAPQASIPATTLAPAKAPAGAEYGPVKRGETLSKIAASVKPEGISLEQVLVGVYRTNPDAFMKNMNRLKAGKKLQIPGKEQLAAVKQQEAIEEVRVQTADWNKYRRRLADMAGASEGKTPMRQRGKLRVEDKAAGGKEGKPVLRLSSGQQSGSAADSAKGRSREDRVRALEEELIAQERALNEANERIKRLEKAVQESAGKGDRAR